MTEMSAGPTAKGSAFIEVYQTAMCQRRRLEKVTSKENRIDHARPDGPWEPKRLGASASTGSSCRDGGSKSSTWNTGGRRSGALPDEARRSKHA